MFEVNIKIAPALLNLRNISWSSPCGSPNAAIKICSVVLVHLLTSGLSLCRRLTVSNRPQLTSYELNCPLRGNGGRHALPGGNCFPGHDCAPIYSGAEFVFYYVPNPDGPIEKGWGRQERLTAAVVTHRWEARSDQTAFGQE